MDGLRKYRGWFIEEVDSPDDGGFYCLAINRAGAEVGSTEVWKSRTDALREIVRFIDGAIMCQTPNMEGT